MNRLSNSYRIFLTFFVFYAFFSHTYLSTNDASRFSLSYALASSGSMRIDHLPDIFIDSERYAAVDIAYYKGHYYSSKAPLGGFLGAVPVFIVRAFNGSLPLMIYCVTVFVSATAGALLCTLFWKTATSLGARAGEALPVVLALGFGTNLLYWSTAFFSHALTGSLVFASYYAIRRADNGKWLLLSGVLGGFAMTSDYYLALALPVLFVYAAFKMQKRAAYFALGTIGPIAAMCLYHYLIIEDPFTFPQKYSFNFTDIHEKGFYGAEAVSIKNIWELTFGAEYGLFTHNPVLLLGALAMPGFLMKNPREAVVPAVLFTIFFLYISSIGTVMFGMSWGPRYFTAVMPFLMLSLAALPEPALIRRALVPVALVSIALNLIFASTSHFPGTPDLRGQIDIVRDIFIQRGSINAVGVFFGLGRFWSIASIFLPLSVALALWRHEIRGAMPSSARQNANLR